MRNIKMQNCNSKLKTTFYILVHTLFRCNAIFVFIFSNFASQTLLFLKKKKMKARNILCIENSLSYCLPLILALFAVMLDFIYMLCICERLFMWFAWLCYYLELDFLSVLSWTRSYTVGMKNVNFASYCLKKVFWRSSWKK